MSLLAMAKSTAVKNCLLSFMSDWMVGKLGAPANANIVVLKAESTLIKKKTKFSSYIRKSRRERLQSNI